MVKRVDYLGSFQCDASDGRVVVVDIFQDIIDISTRGAPAAERGGMKSLRTQDGLAVNRLDKGRYHIDATEEDLTSDDPNAP